MELNSVHSVPRYVIATNRWATFPEENAVVVVLSYVVATDDHAFTSDIDPEVVRDQTIFDNGIVRIDFQSPSPLSIGPSTPMELAAVHSESSLYNELANPVL